jgi:hypothetical protein
MKPQFKFILTALLFISSVASAQDIQLGQPQMDGTGCPSGAVQAVVAPDGSAISILFDNFLVEGRKGANTPQNMKKYCRFHIPVSLPEGYSIDVQTIDYRGFANLAKGNRAYLITTGPAVDMVNMSVGEQGIRTHLYNLVGNYSVTQPVPHNANSGCQSSQSLDFTSVLQLFGPAPKALYYLAEDAQIMIDSLDMGLNQEAIRLHIALKRCQ